MKAASNTHDVLYGVGTIARFVGLPVEEAKRLIATAQLPSFDVGGMACASKEVLRAWRASRERGEVKP
jgi:hypothetical protein